MPDADVRNAWLTVEDVRKIRDLNTKKRNIQLCRDMFMLSYYLGGINIVDLIRINFNEHPEMLHYVRKKTENRVKFNKFVEFQMPEEAKTIIARWKGADGKLTLSDYQRKDSMNGFFRRTMRKLAELTGIKYLIYYSARKSFSQHALSLIHIYTADSSDNLQCELHFLEQTGIDFACLRHHLYLSLIHIWQGFRVGV